SRRVDHLLVEVDLIGALARTGLHHREHIMIPAWANFWPLPIRSPTVVCRINVGGEPFLKAVELIGATKMHLARQHRAIPSLPQVMSESRYVGGEVGGIIPGANTRW